MQETSRRRKILLLSTDAREVLVLREMLAKYAFIADAKHLPELMELLASETFDVLLCDWSFYRGTWRNALACIRDLALSLPVIVLNPAGGEYEWLEVLDEGGFDLLTSPWHEPTVVAALQQALARRDAVTLWDSKMNMRQDEPELVASHSESTV